MLLRRATCLVSGKVIMSIIGFQGFCMRIPPTKPKWFPNPYCLLLIEGQPAKPLPTSKNWVSRSLVGCLSLTKWWLMKIYDMYGLHVWEEHATLAQKTLKVDYVKGENHFMYIDSWLVKLSLSLARYSDSHDINCWKFSIPCRCSLQGLNSPHNRRWLGWWVLLGSCNKLYPLKL